MNEKIDIHRIEKGYNSAKEKLEQNNSIIPVNKELIFKFLYDCELGKTIKGKAKTKIGKSRLLKYLLILNKYPELWKFFYFHLF